MLDQKGLYFMSKIKKISELTRRGPKKTCLSGKIIELVLKTVTYFWGKKNVDIKPINNLNFISI